MTRRVENLGFTRELMATNASAGLARTLITSHLLKWGLPDLVDRATLVVSELFNSAVQVSGRLSTVSVHASVHSSGLWLDVSDTSPSSTPIKRRTVQEIDDIDFCEESDLGGWGLRIVEACADRCWIEPVGNEHKWVCAEIFFREDGNLS